MPPPVQYLNSTHYIPIKVKSANIYEASVNVPWLSSEFSISSAVLGAFRSDGHDIVITDIAGNLIPREIVSFNQGGGTCQIAFRDPAQDPSTGGTQLYIQYGGSLVNIANDLNVWQNNFDGTIDHVIGYHLEESSGDSINFVNPGTYDGTVDATYEATGKIDKGYSFDGSDEVRMQSSDSLGFGSSLTVMTWQKGNSGDQLNIASQYDYGAGQRAWSMSTGNASQNKLRINLSKDGGGVNVKYYESSIVAFDNTLKHIGFTWATDALKLFVNGVDDGSVNVISDTAFNEIHNSTADCMISAILNNNIPDATYQFTGEIDEVRIINGTLSPNEMKSQYENQNGFDINTTLAIGSTIAFLPQEVIMNFSGVRYDYDKKGLFIGKSIMDFLSGCSRGITNLHSHIHEGRAFEIYKVLTAIADNAHTYFEIQVNEDISIHLKNIFMWISEGPVLLKLIEAPTLTTGSTPFVPVNLNRRLKDDSVILSDTVVKSDPTGISGGTEIKQFRFGIGGVGVQENESIAMSEIERVLREDTTYLIDIQNVSGGAIDLSFSVVWYE